MVQQTAKEGHSTLDEIESADFLNKQCFKKTFQSTCFCVIITLHHYIFKPQKG